MEYLAIPANLIKRIPFFADFSQTAKGEICKILKFQEFTPGEVVCKEGDLGTQVFFLVEGTVEVKIKTARGGEHDVLTIYPGHVFGEMALFDNARRTASVIAQTRVGAGTIHRSDFDSLANKDPRLALDILRKMGRIISTRMRLTNAEYAALSQSFDLPSTLQDYSVPNP